MNPPLFVYGVRIYFLSNRLYEGQVQSRGSHYFSAGRDREI